MLPFCCIILKKFKNLSAMNFDCIKLKYSYCINYKIIIWQQCWKIPQLLTLFTNRWRYVSVGFPRKNWHTAYVLLLDSNPLYVLCLSHLWQNLNVNKKWRSHRLLLYMKFHFCDTKAPLVNLVQGCICSQAWVPDKNYLHLGFWDRTGTE